MLTLVVRPGAHARNNQAHLLKMASCKCSKITRLHHQFRHFSAKGHINIVPSRCISSSRKNYSAEPSTKSHEIVKQDPLQHHDYFNVRDLVKMDDLFRYRVHLGHTYGCRNEYMTPYLFGSRLGTDIIDLEQTLPLFQDALNFTAHVAYKEGIILLLNRSLEMMPWVEKTAKEVGEYAHCRYWKGGLFTDSTKFFGTMTRLPDVGIFFNTLNSVVTQHKAITDHAKLLIPTIGIVDTNADPRLVTYPIPGNDDSKETQLYYLKLFREAILRGKAKRLEDQAHK